MSATIDTHISHPREAGDHQAEMDNPRSNLSMHQAHGDQFKSAWHELFTVGGKIPNRRAYHISFVWNNE